MGGVIFHGVKAGNASPRAGRESFELWGMTRANVRYWQPSDHGELTDWSRWFDSHHFEAYGLWPGLAASRDATLQWYRQEPAGGRPIYMQRAEPSVPASRAYPLAEVQHAFMIDEGQGPRPNRMFGCTLDYLFALALYEGKDPIVLNGVGMSHDPGHVMLHRSAHNWIGFARGRGVQVIVEGDSCYRNAERELYGYERYSYADLDALMRSYDPVPQMPDSDLDAIQALVQSWRTVAKSSPQCAAELEHLVATIQRMTRVPAA